MGSGKNHIILKALNKKGFSLKMSGHFKVTFRCKDRDTSIRTWISHGKIEIRTGFLASWQNNSVSPDCSLMI
jgi:hypothetical protein